MRHSTSYKLAHGKTLACILLTLLTVAPGALTARDPGGVPAQGPFPPLPPRPPRTVIDTFQRGEVNGDGVVDMSDAIQTLSFIFTSAEPPSCVRAADVNADDTVDLSDAVSVLSFLFTTGRPPAAPFPGCGWDGDESPLPCESSASCPQETVDDFLYYRGEEVGDRLVDLTQRLEDAGYDPGALSAAGTVEVRGKRRISPTSGEEAFLVGDELRLYSDTVLTLEPEISRLTILVNRLEVERGALVNWRQEALPLPKAGFDGFAGAQAPTVEIWARAMNRLPEIELRGQDGSPGGGSAPLKGGGDGGPGGNGGRVVLATFPGDFLRVLTLDLTLDLEAGVGGAGTDGGSQGEPGERSQPGLTGLGIPATQWDAVFGQP